MRITVTTKNGKHYGTVHAADRVVYATPGYFTEGMALADVKCWLAFHGGNMEEREPRSIRFETVKCGRCEGMGRRTDRPDWAPNHKGICYRCHGDGTVLTAAGYRAQQAYIAERDAALNTTWGELEDGEAFWYDGKCYAKGQHPWLILFDKTTVRRHNGPVCRAIWKDIARRYKGAELVY
ncbi:hypothetical protein [Streptomyces sp. SID8499]|uniref:hypothetical protein n=1 Tax=Streptomyces sp. SID8499 TaxID=2706106 RepID=UPI0013CC483A|nr:hypothetical protein [Streptomyces sp. SID8499]NED36692.1 hypothetical protein [Streptomyces sp. SID8499]